MKSPMIILCTSILFAGSLAAQAEFCPPGGILNTVSLNIPYYCTDNGEPPEGKEWDEPWETGCFQFNPCP